MNILISILLALCIISIAYLIILHRKSLQKLSEAKEKNVQFLESIEKYVEIFNEQNINELTDTKKLNENVLANKTINSINKELKRKLPQDDNLKDEHMILIDCVSLILSLLVKIPPSLRAKLIFDNTENEVIQKILISKLDKLENHYIPISLLEIALGTEEH
jgi:hypothetical protein